MSDLIRREDAIKAVKSVSENYTGKGKRDYHPHIDFIVDELKYAVPSADRPRGEWIEQDDCWQCSNCGDEFVLEVDVKPIDAKMHYCPNCGAKMKGVDDEAD